MRTAGWVLMATLLLMGSPSRAQVGVPYSYPELVQEAELVAIAECLGVHDTGGRQAPPELSSPTYPVQEWRASLRIAVVLKAHRTTGVGSTIALRYFRFDSDKWWKEHPDSVVSHGTYLNLKPGESYLLFLRARAFGMYDPVSSHASPNDSVYLLDRFSAIRN